MYTVTPLPKDRFTTPHNNQRPQSQQLPTPRSSPNHSTNDWKTSSTHRQKPTESWKTSSPSLASSSHQQRQQPQLKAHDPSYHLHRHSMPAGWFLGYDQGRGGHPHSDYNHYPETFVSMPTPQYHDPSPTMPNNANQYYQQSQPEPITATTSIQQQQHHHPSPSMPNSGGEYYQQSRPEPTTVSASLQHDHHPSTQHTLSSASQQKTTESSTKRQITVKSVNEGNRVWIDVLATETGASLAAKIHRIATFGTRKVITITTAQGHAIPLNRRPIFGGGKGSSSSLELAQVEHGEYWQVEWVALDPSVFNKVLSKLIK